MHTKLTAAGARLNWFPDGVVQHSTIQGYGTMGRVRKQRGHDRDAN